LVVSCDQLPFETAKREFYSPQALLAALTKPVNLLSKAKLELYVLALLVVLFD